MGLWGKWLFSTEETQKKSYKNLKRIFVKSSDEKLKQKVKKK